jgi:hypothetical protein
MASGFIKTWFDGFDWLEYSVEKCSLLFFCYLLNLQELVIGIMIHSLKTVMLIGDWDLKLSMLMLEDLIVLIIRQGSVLLISWSETKCGICVV